MYIVLNQFSLNFDSEGHKIEEILGATGTLNVDGDDELSSINPNLFYFFFHWVKDIKNINTCWLQSKNNLETSGRSIHKWYLLDILPYT